MRYAMPAAGGGDVFSTINNLAGNTKSTVIIVGGVLFVILFVVGAWRAKGALAGVLMAFVCALLGGWMLKNVSDSGMQDKIDNTVNNGMSVVHVDERPASPFPTN